LPKTRRTSGCAASSSSARPSNVFPGSIRCHVERRMGAAGESRPCGAPRTPAGARCPPPRPARPGDPSPRRSPACPPEPPAADASAPPRPGASGDSAPPRPDPAADRRPRRLSREAAGDRSEVHVPPDRLLVRPEHRREPPEERVAPRSTRTAFPARPPGARAPGPRGGFAPAVRKGGRESPRPADRRGTRPARRGDPGVVLGWWACVVGLSGDLAEE
jgi:hypothetical protein